MEINYGNGETEYGPGVEIKLTGKEVVNAIIAYLTSREAYICGAVTVRVNGSLCNSGLVYVDPSGFVVKDGKKYSGRGEKEDINGRLEE